MTTVMRAIMLLVGIAYVCTVGCRVFAEQKTFFADLAFLFDCKANADPAPDEAIEQFLQGLGFKVLNVVRVRRERKMTPMLSALFIYGIDQQHRVINFLAEPKKNGIYAVGLYTRPPTNHDTDLEQALLRFAPHTLECHVRQVSRSENDLKAQDAYDEYFKWLEWQFREAENWRRSPI